MKMFRIISVLEGMSYLTILSVTCGFIEREWVSLIGMVHGILFLLYLALSLMLSSKKGWSVLGWLILFLASVVPFAFILVEAYFRKVEQRKSQEIEATV